MALLSNTGIRAGASQPVADDTTTSGVRLNNGDDSYFKRTTGSGNRKTWSFSCWVKRVGLGGYDYIFAQGPDGATSGNWFLAGWQTDNTFWIGQQTGGGYNLQYQTNKRFRDPSAWFHMLIAVDTTQSTGGNRLKLYINGTQETSFSTATEPSEDADTWVGATSTCPVMYIGRQPDGHGLDGYISNVQFVDGAQLTPSDVTKTDSTTGQLVPKTYTGSYGTNGFNLEFADTSGVTATTIGKDSSSNTNNYTPVNLSVTAGTANDALLDSPSNGDSADDTGVGGQVTGNYATFSPLLNGGTLSQGALHASSGTQKRISSAFKMSSGKWYFEFTLTSGTIQQFGIGSTATANITSSPPGDSPHNSYIILTNGSAYHQGSTFATSLPSIGDGDVVGVAFDADSRKTWWSKNGSWMGSGSPNPATGADPLVTVSASYAPYAPAVGAGGADAVNCAFNAGQRPFADTAPSGFKALCTANLPDPAIAKSEEHFDATIYTGNGSSSRSLSPFAFQPDLLWIRARDAVQGHMFTDALRGATKVIFSHLNWAESTEGQSVTAFESDGWSMGNWANNNTNNEPYVAWAWKAATTASGTWGANSKAYSRRTNSSAGFSIIKFVADGSTGIPGTGAIPHGLGGKPDLVISKRLDSTGDWWTGFDSLDGSFDVLKLNDTAAKSDESYTIYDADEISNWGCPDGSDQLYYAFKNIPGYSEVGTYTGNNSSDGKQIILDFKPRFLIIKRTDGVGKWAVNDTARDFNSEWGNDTSLYANSNVVETTSSSLNVDFLSNGFKLRSNNASYNGTGTYLYIAFADRPFKYSRAE